MAIFHKLCVSPQANTLHSSCDIIHEHPAFDVRRFQLRLFIFTVRKMYWADWSRNRPKIEVANMDGTDRRVLVKYPLSLPNGLTLVHSTNELCYSDAGMWAISCVNLGDLSMRKAYNPTTYPFGITSFNRTLFWTDWTLGRIQRMGMNSKIPDKPLRSFVGSNGKIFDIKAVQPCGRTGGND